MTDQQSEMVEAVASAIDAARNGRRYSQRRISCAQAAIEAARPFIERDMLREVKLACVQKSHGPCICGLVDQIASERGIALAPHPQGDEANG